MKYKSLIITLLLLPYCALAQMAQNQTLIHWEANWVGFNHARDFDLYPQPELAPINNFGYPYAEVGGDPLNSFDPKEFKYDYVSKKL